MEQAQNNRVTMAKLGAKLDTVLEQQTDHNEQMDLLNRVIFEQNVRFEKMAGEMATQCQRLDGRINRADDKLKGWQVAQSVLTLLAASIAAFLGSK